MRSREPIAQHHLRDSAAIDDGDCDLVALRPALGECRLRRLQRRLGREQPDRERRRLRHSRHRDACRRDGEHAREAHLLTGELGSMSSATTSFTCCSLRIPLWPKRGMLEHAEKASELYTLPNAYFCISDV